MSYKISYDGHVEWVNDPGLEQEVIDKLRAYIRRKERNMRRTKLHILEWNAKDKRWAFISGEIPDKFPLPIAIVHITPWDESKFDICFRASNGTKTVKGKI